MASFVSTYNSVNKTEARRRLRPYRFGFLHLLAGKRAVIDDLDFRLHRLFSRTASAKSTPRRHTVPKQPNTSQPMERRKTHPGTVLPRVVASQRISCNDLAKPRSASCICFAHSSKTNRINFTLITRALTGLGFSFASRIISFGD